MTRTLVSYAFLQQLDYCSVKQHRKSQSPPVKMEVANDETRPSARLSAFRSIFHWQQQS